MLKGLLYTTAIDDAGELVHVEDALKGLSYYCPSCEGELIFRKSGKNTKGSKRPHFAHKNITVNCTPESVLHYSFKKSVVELLQGCLIEGKPFNANWNCPSCSRRYKSNLLANVTSVREEYNMRVCQPDVALLDANGRVVAVVEVVVTHEPEEKVVNFYIENQIVLIQVNLTAEEDLMNVESRLSNPDILDYCYDNSMCSLSARSTVSRQVNFAIERCGRCYGGIERFYIGVETVFGRFRSLDFTNDEIELVKSKRQYIRVRTDSNTKAKYPYQECMRCKRAQMRFGGGRRF